jgi:CHAT domain-containing protein
MSDSQDPANKRTALDGTRSGLASSLSRSLRKSRSLAKWISALLGLGLVALFVLNPFRSTRHEVDQQIATAYSETRTMEVRIAGASYSPWHQERGASETEPEVRLSLYDAVPTIKRQLSKTPDDPGWLQAKARVDLLDHHFEGAIQSLERALEIEPNSSQLLVDLASGYFERAERGQRVIDYANAIEYLGQALDFAPDDPVALYNRAVVCERTFLYAQAVEDWMHYLKVDPQGAWREDAARRLKNLQAKLDEHQQEMTRPLLEPEDLSGARLDRAGSLQEIDQHIEEYVKRAVTHWLPAAYPVASANAKQTRKTRSALWLLALLARQRHHDPWLNDLLANTSSPDYPEAVAALARAVRANDDDNTTAAQLNAEKAEQLFSSMPNNAGVLRAQLESIFAGHVNQDGDSCLRSALNVKPAIERSDYTWLRAQYHLELGTCFWLKDGSLGKANEFYRRTAGEAKEAGYKEVYLRAQDHMAAFAGNSGNFRESAETISRALALFWNGTYPPMRGYNLYYNLAELARARKQPNLQLSAWDDGVKLIDLLPAKTLRPMAHSLTADAATAAGKPDRALLEFDQVDQLFRMAPLTKANHAARLEAETRRAEVQIGLGRLDEASNLSALKPEVDKFLDKSQDNFLGLLYYTNLGELQARLHDDAHAESSLQTALSFAEQDLRSLNDEKARLQWSLRSSAAYRNLAELKLRQGAVGPALEIWEWYRAAALRSNTPAKNLQSTSHHEERGTFRKANDPKTAAAWPVPQIEGLPRNLGRLNAATTLSFMRLRERYVGWVYDDRGISAFTVADNAAHVDSLARRFRRLCSDRNSDLRALKEQGRVLYDLLIRPAEEKLALRTNLVIEADGGLNGIAFEALVDAQGRYLAEKNSVESSLGLQYRSHRHTAEPVTASSRAVVAVVPASEVVGDLPYLSQVVAEGKTVGGQFRSPIVLNEQQATVAALRSALAGAQVFHFAGHAVASETVTGLLLWKTLFSAESLKGLDLSKLQLAVLSACDTAGEIEGDEYNPDSLVHPFVFAGVPRVVVSRWNVDSEATRQFMELFYQNLLKGKTTAEALKNAEEGLRASEDTKHPYYWAAFTEFGVNLRFKES